MKYNYLLICFLVCDKLIIKVGEIIIMRKKLLIVSLVLLYLFMGFEKVDAKSNCNLDENVALSKEVMNIKTNFEEKERILDPSEYYLPEGYTGDPNDFQLKEDYFQVNLINVTENFYVKITSNDKSFSKTITYNDVKDSVASFNWKDLSKVETLKMKIYTSDKTSCPNEEYRILYLTLPRYNDYHEYAQCSVIPKSSLCQKYVTYEEVGLPYFIKKTNEEIEKKFEKDKDKDKNKDNKSFWNKLKNFLKENKKYILIGLSIILVVGIVVLVIYFQKKKKDIFKK